MVSLCTFINFECVCVCHCFKVVIILISFSEMHSEVSKKRKSSTSTAKNIKLQGGSSTSHEAMNQDSECVGKEYLKRALKILQSKTTLCCLQSVLFVLPHILQTVLYFLVKDIVFLCINPCILQVFMHHAQ